MSKTRLFKKWSGKKYWGEDAIYSPPEEGNLDIEIAVKKPNGSRYRLF